MIVLISCGEILAFVSVEVQFKVSMDGILILHRAHEDLVMKGNRRVRVTWET